MKPFNPNRAAEILEDVGGSIVSISFIKRSNGEQRRIVGKLDVSKYCNGTGMSYSFKDKGLIGIFDMEIAKGLEENQRAKAYRSVPIESIIEIKYNGKTFLP